MTLGQTISSLRERRGLSQVQLAKKLNIGTSTLGMWETDKRKPNPDALVSLANYFDVSTDYLLGNTASGKGSAPEWATEQDKKDLRKFLEDNANSMTYGGEELTNEERQQLRVAMETIFWKRHKHD
ncbi:helix-turn-helix domain-containing protein [Lentilactobacillus sp. G22-6]|uniref:helix-turn-helix domain-containing protein n=1 Tax=Lentilactobacillus dabitei TaxID=2831523 RepID=UPI001C2534C0|nr:helix-turn-helix transcriptional regulator [Lentilactobacillus dabitei]MBU9788589.1 helix-turn-helix domain-containing protein [Lentilactobacillus dabitei]